MTKKLLVIVLLLVVILGNVQVCFADYDSTSFLYDSKNDNASSISISNDNQGSTISNLYSSGYRSIISRYSQQLVHITLSNIYIEIELNYNYSSGAPTSYLKTYLDNLSTRSEFYSYGGNSLDAVNIDSSNLSRAFGNVAASTNFYYIHYYLSGSLSFDMPLQNIQLIKAGQGNSLNWSKLCLDIIPTFLQLSGYNYQLFRIYAVNFNYTLTYEFPQTFSNVDGFYLFNEFTILNNENTSDDVNFAHTGDYVYYNGISTTTENNNAPISRTSLLYTLLDDSKLSSCSINSVLRWTWSAYTNTYNTDYTLSLCFSVFAPLIYNNNSNYLLADSNGNQTPLHLDYYDAEWYELHLQAANAFIFFITEFPLISDITNLIYSLFVMIKNSFEVLLNFNGFGILFGFGMFAIVFGFILKLIIGD